MPDEYGGTPPWHDIQIAVLSCPQFDPPGAPVSPCAAPQNAGNAEIHQYYSQHLSAAGRFAEAIAEARRAGFRYDHLAPSLARAEREVAGDVEAGLADRQRDLTRQQHARRDR